MVDQVVSAVQCIFDPDAQPSLRQQAHQLLEEVKESDACLDVGFTLMQSHGSVTVQHCGLQLIEHVIRYKWNKLTPDNRLEVKNRCVNFIANLSEVENPHLLIREGLSKCMVEMVKREWPQAWPEFMDECQKLCSLGVYQTETVLFLYTRLVQDIILFNTVDHQAQSKQLHSALVQFSGSLIDLALNVLEIACNTSASSGLVEENRVKLCSAAVTLLSNLVHWSPAATLKCRMQKILTSLRVFLVTGPQDLAGETVACLNELISRKGPRKDVEPLVDLFTVENVQPVYDLLKKLSSNAYEEHTYQLLQSVTLLLVPMAANLAILWDAPELKDRRLAVLKSTLSVLLVLFVNPALVRVMPIAEKSSVHAGRKTKAYRIRCLASQALVALAKSSSIISSNEYRNFFKNLIQVLPSALQKIGLPNSFDEPYCSFSRANYDNTSVYLIDLTRLRECCCTILREDVANDYRPAGEFVSAWCKSVLASVEEAASDPLYDCYLLICSTVYEAMQKDEETIARFRPEATELLDCLFVVMESQTNVLVINKLLSLFTGLVPFVDFSYWRLPAFICRLVQWMMYDDVEHDFVVSNHISHLLVKLASTCPNILMPHFDVIANGLKMAAPQMRVRVKCHMVDVLFALSNGFNNYEFQRSQTSTYLAETAVFCSSVADCLSSPENFLAYICSMKHVDEEPIIYGTRRKEFMFHIQLVSSIINRIRLPSDLTAAANGDYCVNDGSGVPRIRHPSFEMCVRLLPTIFRLARCVNGIYENSCVKRMPTEYSSSILDLQVIEKLSVLGSYNQLKNDCGEEKLYSRVTVEDQIRGFIADITENVQVLIARCVCRFGWQFYQLPEAEKMLDFGLLGYLDSCLDYRLHILIRKALIPIVSAASDEVVPVLLTPLKMFINHCYERLTNRWNTVITNLEETCHSQRDPSDQEVYLEHMTCILTRDTATLLRQVLRAKSCKGKAHSDDVFSIDGDEDGHDQMMEEIDSGGGSLSLLGSELLSSRVGAYTSLVLLMYHMLGWHDSLSVVNIASLCYPVASELLSKKLLDEASARHLFVCLLQGVQQHCLVDDTLGKLFELGCKLYSLFLPAFPNACKEVLLTLPETSEEVVTVFDQKMQNSLSGSVKIADKVKRTMFKKVVKGITNPEQHQKRRQDFRELPVMLRPRNPPREPESIGENELRFLFDRS